MLGGGGAALREATTCVRGELACVTRLALLVTLCVIMVLTAGSADAAGSLAGGYRVPVPVQGEGVVLQAHPQFLLANRNVKPPSFSGYDGIGVRRWEHWGGRRSVASGTYYWNSPGHTRLRRFAVRVELIRPRACGKYRVYRRIRVRFRRESPPHMSRSIGFRTLRYACSGGG